MMSQNLVTATAENVAALRVIVAEELELDLLADQLDEDADFVEEYDADSLGLIQVLARIERELGVVIPPESIAEMTSLRSVVELTARHGGWEIGRG
jgi:acyl carrier protein